MSQAKRIFIVSETTDYTKKLFIGDIRKRMKGFVRLGHDVQVFGYNAALAQESAFKSRSLSRLLYKQKVDELLQRQLRFYCPDVVLVGFSKYLNDQTVRMMREAAGQAFFLGYDVDIYPEQHRGRIEAAAELDSVLTTYAGDGLESYRSSGVSCVFMPNICDPDIEHRYPAADEWKSEILFIGKFKHKNYPTDDLRPGLLTELSRRKDFTCYGCFGKPPVWGTDLYRAISGSRFGLSINADNNIRLYHSDRLTLFLSCGSCVLAKRVPDTELLFRDKEHVLYFDTAEEFFDLVAWYQQHEKERALIANRGMEYTHREFNCKKIAQYTLEVIETGTCSAPWMSDD
ncbi:MAG: glycosyltransferase [Sedimentisphaerales bacterium]|nr:glycosyltransferase [Sedimentisphaerales bacterium]